jgi:hypothetical protein
VAAASEAMRNQITKMTDTENDFVEIGTIPLLPIQNYMLELQTLHNNCK